MRQSAFVAVVGPDGAGKSTLLERLKAEFTGSVVVREPGGTALAETIRSVVKDPENWAQIPLPIKMLHFWMARNDLLFRVVWPFLEQGTMVFADRFDACTFAYQVSAEGLGKLEELFWLERETFIVDGGMEPDLYIWLDCDVEIGIDRRKLDGMTSDFYDQKGAHFFHRVRQGYQKFFKEAEAPYIKIDASQDKEVVFQQAVEAIGRIFSPAQDSAEEAD